MSQIHPSGRLVVITGKPAAGKDFVANIIEHDPLFAPWRFSRLITYADRPPRPGETHGVEHYFVSPSELHRKHLAGELVENPILTGSSYKATPKSEFHKILYEGRKTYWRIDPSLAVKVAVGTFFEEIFTSEECLHLKKHSLVILVDAPPNLLEQRRRQRDGSNYRPEDYRQRDEYETKIFTKYPDVFQNIIQNLDNNLEDTKHQLFQLLSSRL